MTSSSLTGALAIVVGLAIRDTVQNGMEGTVGDSPDVPRIARIEPAPVASAATEKETPLVRRARAVLERNLNRAQVIRSLGPATWAVLPKDHGPFAMEPGDAALLLYWRNGNCTPVSAAFDESMRLIGGTAIAQCLGVDTNPGSQYACTKADRAALCR
jgi:hypothetical protein